MMCWPTRVCPYHPPKTRNVLCGQSGEERAGVLVQLVGEGGISQRMRLSMRTEA